MGGSLLDQSPLPLSPGGGREAWVGSSCSPPRRTLPRPTLLPVSVTQGTPPRLCSPPCGPSTSLLHRDPPSHTQLPDFTRASALSPLSILPPTPETSPVSSAPLDTPASQNKSSSLGLTRPCPHGGRWRPSSERPSDLSRGSPSPYSPPPAPRACCWEEGSQATSTSVPPPRPALPSAPRQAPQWGSIPQPLGGGRTGPHPPLPLSNPPSSLGPPTLRVGHSSVPHWDSASPGVHRAQALPWSPRWLAARCPQGVAHPPLQESPSLPCPEPHHPFPPEHRSECLHGFWSCGHPPAPTQPLVSPWPVPGPPGQEQKQEGWPGFTPLPAS